MGHDVDERVDGTDRIARAVDLGPADVVGPVDDLPLEVRELDVVVVHDPEGPHARRREVEQGGGAETARAHDEDPGVLEPALTVETEAGDDHVPRLAGQLGRAQAVGRFDEGWQRHGSTLRRTDEGPDETCSPGPSTYRVLRVSARPRRG
jgi:hypothetical protein